MSICSTKIVYVWYVSPNPRLLFKALANVQSESIVKYFKTFLAQLRTAFIDAVTSKMQRKKGPPQKCSHVNITTYCHQIFAFFLIF